MQLAFFATTLIAGIVYAVTSAPGLGLVDSGELTAAACGLNIPHPSGYPLYVLAGRVWLALSLANPARAMVLFSVVAGATAAGVMTLVAVGILRQFTDCHRVWRIVIAIGLGVGFALSHSAWSAVSFAEVYPLAWLLAALLLLFAMSAVVENSSAAASGRWPLLIVYVWGLAFGNHLTIIWFAPLVVFVVILHTGWGKQALRPLLICACFFILGLSTVLFLPIRSALNPVYDWSNPESLQALLRHVTGWQYRVWMFTGGFAGLLGKFADYVISIPRELGWILSAYAAIGIIPAMRAAPRLALALLLSWLLGIGYNLNYDIPDISTYFLIFYCPLYVYAVFGVVAMIGLIKRLKFRPSLRHALLGLVGVLPIAPVVLAVPDDAVQSRNRFAEYYVRSVLQTLPDSALVFQANWDIQSPFEYLKQVENYRPDVVMLDINLMQRSWYVEQEMRRRPQVFQKCEQEVAEFLKHVALFETGRPYNAQRLEAAFVAMHDCLIEHNRVNRPVYLRDTYAIGHPGVGERFSKVPGGFFWRIGAESSAEPVFPVADLRLGKHRLAERERYLLKDVARSVELQGRYAMQSADTATVRRTIAAMEILPYPDARSRAYAVAARAFLPEEVSSP